MKRNGLSVAVKMIVMGAVAGSLIACGGSGSGSGSSASSGNDGRSVGAVTGFGSVYVNGTRFKTDGTVTSNDGLEREDQLHKGMVLKVNGSWNGQGEGQARDISYDDTLRGPLTEASWDSAAQTGHLTLLNQNVALDGKTVFRGATAGELAANPMGYRVRVSGWRTSEGQFRASYVGAKLIDGDFEDSNEAELEGIVADLDATAQTFTISGLSVDYQLASGDDDFDLADLENGMAVEVEGYLQAGVLMAKEIEKEDDLFEDDDDVEISGDIFAFDESTSTFMINGVQVQFSDDTEFDDMDSDTLQDGTYVKVEGEFRNGVLIAEEIEGQEGDAELSGKIQAFDRENEILTVSGVKVWLTDTTLIETDSDERRSREDDLNALQIGDFVEVEGRQRDTDGGYLEAYAIEVEDDEDGNVAEIEGRVDAKGQTSLTIMNLDILFGAYSAAGVSVGDEVEIEYTQNAGGDFELASDVSE
ncbi:hypothetical protein DOQ08_01575 [Marinobacter litoralis]|uniref:DUF5666 domain-containing protein n=1 Tax=Marinobacter litoralis TaxID=187981 RepID=A0A3M2RH73_9GAMM|nr:DUF5666 domain-containing protein [Marinobacter litoralis]RMJ04255.1 hypothetical protein DOQ08_01575 [Marinobacter litoralis]